MKALRWMPNTRPRLRRMERNAVIWLLLGLGGVLTGLLAKLPAWYTVIYILMVLYAVTLFVSAEVLLRKERHGRDHSRKTC